MTKEQLIKKVYRCIDETYPDTTEQINQDEGEFNIPAFLDEAVRWVVNAVPVSALGGGSDNKTAKIEMDGTIKVPSGFLRMLRFKLKDWKSVVTDAKSENDPKYWQQQNPALRGGNSRPMVFLVKGETALEPIPMGAIHKIEVFDSFDMTKGTDGYYDDFTKFPDKLLDITAWKTAELIFSTMQDANGVSVAQAQIQNILPTL
jgi:hypothetical protein